MKTKGQRIFPYVIDMLAFNSMGLRDGSRRRLLESLGRGFESPQVHHNDCPTNSANYLWGTSSGRSHKDGVSTPAVILAQRPEESKGQNDVPQLSNGVQEVRERSEGLPALPLPPVLQDIHRAPQWAFLRNVYSLREDYSNPQDAC